MFVNSDVNLNQGIKLFVMKVEFYLNASFSFSPGGVIVSI